MRTLIGILTTAAMVAGCATAGPAPLPAAPSLAGTTWTVADINGAKPTYGQTPTISFGPDGRVTGESGCNRYRGPYSQGGEDLRFGQLLSTMRACQNKAGFQEARYLRVLNNVEEAGVVDDKLVLRGDIGQLIFVPASRSSGTAQGPVRFECDTGEQISVSFSGDTATIDYPGGEDILAQAASGSGFLYEGPRNSIRGKGDDLTWNRARMAPKQCRKA